MEFVLDVATSRLRRECITNAELRDSQSVQLILDADSKIRMARDLADRFRKRAEQFKEQQRSNDSLPVIREAVDHHLPWQAGRDLCEVLDSGLLDTPGVPREKRRFDLRVLSPGWCSRILAGLASNDGRLRSGISEPTDPQLLKTLHSVIDQHETKPQEKRAAVDNLAVGSTWWSFIRNELTKTEAYVTRLGPDVAMHWQFVDVLEGLAAGSSCGHIAYVKPFNGESSDDRLLLRLRTAARLQAEACAIVAEQLDAIYRIESEELGDRVRRIRKSTILSGDDDSQPDETPILTETHRQCLQWLQKLEGNEISPIKQKTLAPKIDKFWTEENLKQPMSELSKMGYTASRTGRNGGSWITDDGIERLKQEVRDGWKQNKHKGLD